MVTITQKQKSGCGKDLARRNFSRALEVLLLLNPRMIRKRPGQVNQEASQEDKSMCKGAQVEPAWLGQSCGGGAEQQQALLDLFIQVNGEIQDTGGPD